MSAQSIYPTIGMKGLWSISAPFNSLVIPTAEYTCVSIRTFADTLADGEDPRAAYYTDQGITVTDDVYNSDLQGNASVVGLSYNGLKVYIPAPYITSYPVLDGMSFSPLAISITLNLVRDDQDLTDLKNKLLDLVKYETGIDASAQEIVIGSQIVLTYTQAQAIANLRALQKGTDAGRTQQAVILQQQALIAEQQTKISLLEQALIAAHGP
jgi:hypothetical protein